MKIYKRVFALLLCSFLLLGEMVANPAKVFAEEVVPVSSYTIGYDGNGADEGSMQDQSAALGTEVTLVANAYSKTGYKFSGWNTATDGSGSGYSDQQKVDSLSSQPNSKVMLYAQWSPISYSINFHGNGADSGSMSALTDCKYDTSISLTHSSFKRTGFTFNGWNTQADGSGTSYRDSASVKNLTSTDGQSVTLYAQWKDKTYSIQFKGNGATSGTMARMTGLNYSQKYNLSKNRFKKKYYTFNGWNTKKDGSGTKFADQKSVSKLSAKQGKVITLYAQWKENRYNISFDGNGADSGSVATLANRKFTATVKIPSNGFKKTGYIFTGWNTKANGKGKTFTAGQKVSKLTASNGKTIVLYAQWKPITYQIHFGGRGASSGSMDDMTGLSYGTKYRLTKNTFVKTGYTFKEWNTKKDGSGTSYRNGQKIKNLVTKDGKTRNLFAQWTPITYTIAFDKNGGYGKMNNISCTYDQAVTLTNVSYKKTKYKFLEWNTKADGTGTSYANAASVKNLTATAGSTVTLYAIWEEDFPILKLSATYHTQKEVQTFLNNHPVSTSDTYATAPSVTGTISAGVLSANTLSSSLNTINNIRYIAGLNSNVANNLTYSDLASKATLLNYLNGSLSHTPARPTAISASSYDLLYNNGCTGAAKSNIASGFSSIYSSIVSGYMYDSDATNISILGHRRWILYPNTKELGFGKTGGYYALYALGDYNGSTSKRIAWPAQNTPASYFTSGSAWSLSLGRSIEASKVKVVITGSNNTQKWTFTSKSADGNFYVNNSNMGDPGCIIFQPSSISTAAGTTYTVRVFLYDTEQEINYKVNFF